MLRNPLGERSDANRKKNITVNLKGEGCDDKMCMQLAQGRVLKADFDISALESVGYISNQKRNRSQEEQQCP